MFENKNFGTLFPIKNKQPTLQYYFMKKKLEYEQLKKEKLIFSEKLRKVEEEINGIIFHILQLEERLATADPIWEFDLMNDIIFFNKLLEKKRLKQKDLRERIVKCQQI